MEPEDPPAPALGCGGRRRTMDVPPGEVVARLAMGAGLCCAKDDDDVADETSLLTGRTFESEANTVDFDCDASPTGSAVPAEAVGAVGCGVSAAPLRSCVVEDVA